ncbi:hypothetical protein D3C80_595900 [compost metagenome]
MIQRALTTHHSLHEMVSQQQNVANSEDDAIKLINHYIPFIEEQSKVKVLPTGLLDITGALRTSNIIWLNYARLQQAVGQGMLVLIE